MCWFEPKLSSSGKVYLLEQILTLMSSRFRIYNFFAKKKKIKVSTFIKDRPIFTLKEENGLNITPYLIRTVLCSNSEIFLAFFQKSTKLKVYYFFSNMAMCLEMWYFFLSLENQTYFCLVTQHSSMAFFTVK